MIRLATGKENVTKEGILKYITEYDIYRHFIGEDFIVGSVISSPLRRDRNPSFGIYWSKTANSIRFKDYATGENGNCFDLAQKYLKIRFKSVLEYIAIEFNIDDNFDITTSYANVSSRSGIKYDADIMEKIKKSGSSKFIGINRREWNDADRSFWSKYGISKKLLEEYKVAPIKMLYINDKIIPINDIAYAYEEEKDGEIRYKIYQPYNKNIKWINNYVDNTLSGWKQLPDKGDLLFIASSLKDGLVLRSLGYNFIAPQSEGYGISNTAKELINKRFKNIYVFFDYDEAGIKGSEKLANENGYKQIFTYKKEYKDPSDFVTQKNGRELLKQLIITKIK